MTGRVPWERYDGNDIEAVIAIMLSLKNPQCQRIRPAQGDGGVDVLVPHNSSQWEVYQVKGFTQSLTDSHKRQITDSWNRLRAFTRQRGIEVTAWHVVRPIDPTHPERDWLEHLTSESRIPSDWMGLSHVDGWAAQYPEVINYYLRDGAQTVNDQAMRFLSAAGLDQRIRSGQLVEPEQTLEGLLSWSEALNAMDPHFRYELSTLPAPENGEFVLAQTDPGLVSSTTLVRNNRAARLDVYEKFNGAERERGAEESFRLILAPQTHAEHQAVQDFFAYGTPLEQIPVELPTGPSSAVFGVPSAESVRVSMLSVADAPSLSAELSAVQEDGGRGPALPLTMGPVNRGIDGSGRWSWTVTAANGLVSIDMRVTPADGSLAMTVELGEMTGLRPRVALEALEALATMTEGTALELRIPDGPPLLELHAASHDLVPPDDLRSRTALCECLLRLQQHIPQTLHIPAPDEVSVAQVKDWFTAAALLQGEVVMKRWESLGLTVVDHSRLHLPTAVRVTRPLKVRLGGRDWTVGLVDQQVIAGSWLPAESQDGDAGMLLPGADTRLRLSLATDEHARHRAETGVVQTAPIAAAGLSIGAP